MSKLCSRCGDIMCETCNGTGHIVTVQGDNGFASHCPDCHGYGWVDGECLPMGCPNCLSTNICFHREDGGGYFCGDCAKAEEDGNMMSHPILGTDLNVLCPECTEEMIAASENHVKDAIDGNGVRPFRTDV